MKIKRISFTGRLKIVRAFFVILVMGGCGGSFFYIAPETKRMGIIPIILWSFETGGAVHSSPSLGDIDNDGKLEVVVGSWDNKIYALNGENGSLLWSYTTGRWVYSSPSLGDIDNDGKLEVVVGSWDGKIYALNGEDGSLLWSYTTGSYVSSSPSLGDIDNDGKLEVVVGSGDKKIYALNGENGSLLWSYTTGNAVRSSPSLADIDNDGKLEVVVGSDDKKIYALNGEDGSLLWSYPTRGRVYSSPSLGDIDNDGKLEVVVGSWDGKIYALNGEDGSLLWSYTTGDYVVSSPALGDIDNDGKLEVVVGSDDNKIYALNGENGSLLWSYTTGDYVSSSPSLGDIDNDGKLEVVVGSNDGKIYALNGEDGSLLWSYKTGDWGESSPSLGDIDNDRKLEVVVGSDDDKIYAISTGSSVPSPELLPWPKFKHDLFNSGNYGGIKIKKKPKYPPYLTMKASIKDENGNNVIEGGEKIDITIDVSNKGKGDAYAVKAIFLFKQGSQETKEEKTIGDIEAGTSKKLSHSFSVPLNIKNGKCEIRIDVSDSNGYKAEEYLVGMGCAELPPPIFSVYSVIDDDLVGKSSGNGNGNIEAGETIELKLNVRNEGRGIGRDVEVYLSSTDDIDIIEDVAKIGNIPPDASGEGVVVFSVPGDFKKERISLELKVKEKTGLFSKTERKSYPVYKRVVAQEIGASGGTVQTLPTLAVFPPGRGSHLPKDVDTMVFWRFLIESATKSGRYNVLTKDNVWTTLRDKGKDPDEVLNKCAEAICLVDHGRILQADYIIGSELEFYGGTYIFTITLYDVSTSKVIRTKTGETKVGSYEAIKSLIQSTCEELLGMR